MTTTTAARLTVPELRYITAAAPHANGQRIAPGTYVLVVKFELEGGGSLYVEMGAADARKWQAVLTRSGPDAPLQQLGLPLLVDVEAAG